MQEKIAMNEAQWGGRPHVWSERAPLLAPARLRPVRRRYHHNVCRRFCTIALSSILIATLVSMLFSAFVDPDYRYGPDHPWLTSMRGNLTKEELKALLIGIPSSHMASKWSRHYTSGPHLAGANYSLAAWTRDKWEEFGIMSHIVDYDVYLNYPLGHRLAMLNGTNSNAKAMAKWEVAYEASLIEDVLEEDPTSGLQDSIPTFHGYSASGNVTAPFVYVNYGTYQDFADLVAANVSIEGKIAIARYGEIFRGLKIQRAQELGMVGVVLFTDPGDDGEMTEENGIAQYPNGPARQASSVQRGSAQFLSIAPGDPTTPGYPSKPGVPRHSTDHVLPKIPSIPISYKDALPILKSLNGIGLKSSDLNKHWTRNEGLRYKGVEYNIGPSPDSLVLNLYNQQEYVTTPLWNVIGVINGSISDEVVIIGNHRDAWVAGGAGDPNSGSAVMMEVIRAFGEVVKAGWKPLRTIVFASWDGEEYALIGSTEWVEEYLPWLSATNVAYVNVDIGVSGSEFIASAAPVLDKVLIDATKQVRSPNQTAHGQTIGDVWDGRITTMGSGSDFTAFQDFAGVPCIDMGFSQGIRDPVYHYHSNYDSFHWMEKYGDPGFKYHKAISQLLAVLVAELVDSPLIPFNATDYAVALGSYVKQASKKLEALENGVSLLDLNSEPYSKDELAHLRASTFNQNRQHPHHQDILVSDNKGGVETVRKALDILLLRIHELREHSARLDLKSESLSFKLLHNSIPWWKFWEWLKLIYDIRKTNSTYKTLERNFLFEGGLDGRPWFKHVVFAPGRWTGYAGGKFLYLLFSVSLCSEQSFPLDILEVYYYTNIRY